MPPDNMCLISTAIHSLRFRMLRLKVQIIGSDMKKMLQSLNYCGSSIAQFHLTVAPLQPLIPFKQRRTPLKYLNRIRRKNTGTLFEKSHPEHGTGSDVLSFELGGSGIDSFVQNQTID